MTTEFLSYFLVPAHERFIRR